MTVPLCPWDAPHYLIFSANIPHILYYAQIPGMIAGTILGLFVLLQSRSRLSLTLLFLVGTYCIWGVLNLVLFATNRSDVVMMWWSITILVEPLIYAASFYLAYMFIEQRDPPLIVIITLGLLLLPLFVVTPSHINLIGVRLNDCTAIEGPVALYISYILEAILLLWTLAVFIMRNRRIKETHLRKRNTYFIIGLTFFLLTFSSGNIIGSFTSDWVTSQYGYFGMPIFIGILAYLVVHYKAFNVKLIGAQALVITLVVLVGSQFFFAQSYINLILIGVTFLLTIGFGYFLVRSVQREIQRKEELQKISDELARVNEELRRLDNAKTEFISIASHQLRTPLTAIKGFVSLLVEGAYGKMDGGVRDTLNKVYLANTRLMLLVENLLNISRIESGRVQYQFAAGKVEDILRELADLFALPAHDKKLKLVVDLPQKPLPRLVMDTPKIRETLSNLVDNAIKYTQAGSITITARAVETGIEIVVADTGMGIDAEDLAHLFGKFERGKLAARVNVSSTGLGLYVGKSFVTAHGGTITAASDGPGQGSRFTVILPLKPPAES